MEKHLVLVGGGHAHLTALLNAGEFIRQGHRVTLIGPSEYHYYSGMGPGLLSGIYRPEEIRFHVKKMAEDRGASFVQGWVKKIDPKARALFLKSGDTLPYDVVSFNAGSYVPRKNIPDASPTVFPVKPIENLLKARHLILEQLPDKALQFVIVGGGAAGFELSCNLRQLINNNGASAKITLIAGTHFLSAFPDKLRQAARQALSDLDIEIVEGRRVQQLTAERIFLEDGREITADFVFLSWGIKPSPLFRKSGLPTGDDGGLLVNRFLQSVKYPEIFGGGDCICFEPKKLDKVGVYAVRQNPILYHNLLAALNQQSMKPFDPGGSYLLIFNLGNGRGILKKNRFIWQGRLSFYLKDTIDRRFMKKFQVSGECA